ncbi:SlyX family protein [Mailhella sp.]|jgi:SlyX protein|uniref:SlyX family protein n=1 Tax=Mailhella sp. TaxID=1981029 RepID=UPI004064C2E9
MDTEEKLVRLEEQAYFQEKLLAQLNEALTFQQAQIDLLEKRIAELEQNVTSLLEASPQDAPAHTLPPHYMPERY